MEPAALEPIEGLRAWIVVLGVFIVHFVVIGNLYSFGLFVSVYQDRYDVGRTEVSVIYQLMVGFQFGMGIISGPAADRFGIRRVVLFGTVLTIAGFLAAAYANTLVASILTHGALVGAGSSFALWPALVIIPMWFDKRRALAQGVGVFGAGIGSFVISVALERMLEEIGLEATLRVSALYSGVLLLLGVACLKRRLPKEPLSVNAQDKANLMGFRMRMILLCAFFFQIAQFVPFNHLAPSIEDEGLSKQFAALAVGVVGIGSSVGRVLLGVIGDVLGRLRTFQGVLFLTSFSFVLWYFAGDSEGIFLAFAFLYGFASGGFIALVPVVFADYYGVEKLGLYMGATSLALIPGGFIGPYMAAALFDSQGDYSLAIILTGAACLISALFTLTLDKPQKNGDGDAEKNQVSPEML